MPAYLLHSFPYSFIGKICNIKFTILDFPDAPVAKTLFSQCRGPGFDPGQGTISHSSTKNSHVAIARSGVAK